MIRAVEHTQNSVISEALLIYELTFNIYRIWYNLKFMFLASDLKVALPLFINILQFLVVKWN